MAVRTFRDDYKFGVQSEQERIDAISNYFKVPLLKGGSKDRFDFKTACDTVYVELKTRTNRRDAYPTTLIPYSKIEYANANPSRSYHFVFAFVDGLYTIQYDAELFKTFKVDVFCRNRRADYIDKPQMYCFIPVELLERVENTPDSAADA
jgi:hypothetical protein